MRRLFAIMVTMLLGLAIATGPARADIVEPDWERESHEQRTPGCASVVVGSDGSDGVTGHISLVAGVAVVSIAATAAVICLGRKRKQ